MIMFNDDDDLDRLVAELESIWPYDGPHSPETVTDAARAISLLVRYINNATSTRRRYRYMSDVAQVANPLAAAAYGLDQLLDQMSTAIDQHIATGGLYDDQSPADPDAAIAKADLAVNRIVRARSAPGVLAKQLLELGSTTSTIGHR